jgi:hypothetical protein
VLPRPLPPPTVLITFSRQATNISRLVRLPGIVISASVLSSRAIRLSLTCKSCRHVTSMEVQGGFSGFTLPRKCMGCAVFLFPAFSRFSPFLLAQIRRPWRDEGLPARSLHDRPRQVQLRRSADDQAARSAGHGSRWRASEASHPFLRPVRPLPLFSLPINAF